MKYYRSIVHIGFHKTGTTSIQEFLSIKREQLLVYNLAFYSGLHIQNNHVELHAAAMRKDRISPFRYSTDYVFQPSYRQHVQESIDAFAQSNAGKILVFSAEGLSYLRFDDEIEWLASIIPGPVLIVAYLRNKADYIKSYHFEMSKHRIPVNDDRESVAYTGEDTWLLDYEKRMRPFQDRFGHQNTLIVDYDNATRKVGSVIPSFLDILNVSHLFPREEQLLFLNRSPPVR